MNGLKSSWSPYQDQDAASSDDELPAKGKSTFKERSAAVGREAALQKQLQEAYKDRQDLVKRYETKDQKCNELRDKLKATKAALASRERELEMAQRMLQKLGQEKHQLRDEQAENKVYTRKLEVRLEELKGTAELSSKYQASKLKVHDLQQQLMSATAELEACKDVAQQRAKEVERLNRALDIRASELSDEAGGQDIPAKLLHSLAESREESLELAKQLAATKSEMNKLKASAARLSSRAEAAELMRADAEVAAEQLKQRLEKLVGSSQEVTKQRSDMGQLLVAARSEAETFMAERDELAEVVLEMQEEIQALKAATQAAHTRGEAAAAAAADEAMHQIASSHAAAEDALQQQVQREVQLSQRCDELAQQSAQLEAALQQQLAAAQQSAAARQQQILVLESQVQTHRQRELQLERQVANLQMQTEKLGGVVSSAEAAASRTSQLEQQVFRLEASLRVANVERQQLEQRLQQMRDDAAVQQQEVQREMDDLRVQLAAKEAAHRCAQEDIQELQSQLSKAMDQLNKASASKAQLQHNMLHQISSIKEKLQQAELQSHQQLSQSTSPIFRNRSSSGCGVALRGNRSQVTRANAHLCSDSTVEHHQQQRSYDDIAAAALDAARRAKAGSSVQRSLVAKLNVAAAGSRTLSADGLISQRKHARHSVGSIGSTNSSTTSWRQQTAQDRPGSAGRGLLERQKDMQLAAVTASKVADFAATLQQSRAVLAQKQSSGGLNNLAAADTVRPGGVRKASAVPLNQWESSLEAARAPYRSNFAAGRNAAVKLQPSQQVSHADNSSAAYGEEQRVAFGLHVEAGRQLSSSSALQRGHSSGSGSGTAGDVAAWTDGSSNVGIKQHQFNRNSSAGLADELGGDSVDWHSILKAADMQASAAARRSPPAAIGNNTAGDGSSSRAHSPVPLNDQEPSAFSSQQEQQRDAAASRRGFSVPLQLQTTNLASSRRSGHLQQDAAAAAVEANDGAIGALPNSCSWLQQPVEIYSPSVMAQQLQRERNAAPTAAYAVGITGKTDGFMEPYSLPVSAEQSAVSVHLQGSTRGAAAVAALNPPAVGWRTTSMQSTGQRHQQQQPQVTQQQSGAPGTASYNPRGRSATAASAVQVHQQGNVAANRATEFEQQRQHQNRQHEQLARFAAVEATGGANCIAGEMDHGSVLQECGAMEITFDSDSSTDGNPSDGCVGNRSRRDSDKGIATGQQQWSPNHAAISRGPIATGAAAKSPQHSRLEASKEALRNLSSRSRQESGSGSGSTAEARRRSDGSNTSSGGQATHQQLHRPQQQKVSAHTAAPLQQGLRTPPAAAAGAVAAAIGPSLLSPPSTRRVQQQAVARTAGMQPVRMQGFEAEDPAAQLPAHSHQQQQQRPQSRSGSVKLHHDPSLSSWTHDAPGSSVRKSLNFPQHESRQKHPYEGENTASDATGCTLNELLTRLNDGTPTLQDLAQLEGLL